MSQAHRQSRALHPIRAAARRWRAETRRAHTGLGALVRGRLLCMRRCSRCKGRGQVGARLLRQFDRRSGVI